MGCKVIFFHNSIARANFDLNFCSLVDVILGALSHRNASTGLGPALAGQDLEATSARSVFPGITVSPGAGRVTATSLEPRRSRAHMDNLVDVMKLDSATAK